MCNVIILFYFENYNCFFFNVKKYKNELILKNICNNFLTLIITAAFTR